MSMKKSGLFAIISVLVVTMALSLASCKKGGDKPSPTAEATAAVNETAAPTEEATAEATAEATVEATAETTAETTPDATAAATEEATIEATVEATLEATPVATSAVTATAKATSAPTAKATAAPTKAPVSAAPTAKPTAEPTAESKYVKTTYNGKEIFSNSKAQGRADAGSLGVNLYWSADSVEFNLDCKGDVELVLNAVVKNVYGEAQYVSIFVDGKLWNSSKDDQKINGKKTFTVKNLAEGVHNFRIVKQNEPERGQMYVKSITCTGKFAAKPANNKYYIEFVGDSLTTGFANLANSSTSNYVDNKFEDATQAFSYLTAMKLGADYSIVAEEGIGILYGYQKHFMPDVYPKVCSILNKNADYNFSARKPNIIVIALGSNDWSNNGSSASLMKDAVKKMVNLVREKNPGVKIVWAYGAHGYGAEDAIKAALNELGGEAKNIYYFHQTANFDGGCSHPSVAANEKESTAFANYLKTLLK